MACTADEFDVPDGHVMVVATCQADAAAAQLADVPALLGLFQAKVHQAMRRPRAGADVDFVATAHFSERLRQRWVWDGTPVERMWPRDVQQLLVAWYV